MPLHGFCAVGLHGLESLIPIFYFETTALHSEFTSINTGRRRTGKNPIPGGKFLNCEGGFHVDMGIAEGLCTESKSKKEELYVWYSLYTTK